MSSADVARSTSDRLAFLFEAAVEVARPAGDPTTEDPGAGPRTAGNAADRHPENHGGHTGVSQRPSFGSKRALESGHHADGAGDSLQPDNRPPPAKRRVSEECPAVATSVRHATFLTSYSAMQQQQQQPPQHQHQHEHHQHQHQQQQQPPPPLPPLPQQPPQQPPQHPQHHPHHQHHHHQQQQQQQQEQQEQQQQHDTTVVVATLRNGDYAHIIGNGTATSWTKSIPLDRPATTAVSPVAAATTPTTATAMAAADDRTCVAEQPGAVDAPDACPQQPCTTRDAPAGDGACAPPQTGPVELVDGTRSPASTVSVQQQQKQLEHYQRQYEERFRHQQERLQHQHQCHINLPHLQQVAWCSHLSPSSALAAHPVAPPSFQVHPLGSPGAPDPQDAAAGLASPSPFLLPPNLSATPSLASPTPHHQHQRQQQPLTLHQHHQQSPLLPPPPPLPPLAQSGEEESESMDEFDESDPGSSASVKGCAAVRPHPILAPGQQVIEDTQTLPPGMIMVDADEVDSDGKALSSLRGEVYFKGSWYRQSRSTPFPRRLFHMIASEAVNNSTVVAWAVDGRAFFIHDEQMFITDILPKYNFKASKIASFQRNLNIYGFQRMVKGPHSGGYVHPLFHRDMDTVTLSKISRRETTMKGGEPLRALKSHGASDAELPKARERSPSSSPSSSETEFATTPPPPEDGEEHSACTPSSRNDAHMLLSLMVPQVLRDGTPGKLELLEASKDCGAREPELVPESAPGVDVAGPAGVKGEDVGEGEPLPETAGLDDEIFLGAQSARATPVPLPGPPTNDVHVANACLPASTSAPTAAVATPQSQPPLPPAPAPTFALASTPAPTAEPAPLPPPVPAVRGALPAATPAPTAHNFTGSSAAAFVAAVRQNGAPSAAAATHPVWLPTPPSALRPAAPASPMAAPLAQPSPEQTLPTALQHFGPAWGNQHPRCQRPPGPVR